MFHDNNPARSAGPFGYTLGDLTERPPEELDEMGRELEEVENNLQWGFEPGRWADGAEYYRSAWPRAKLLGADAFAQSFDQRNELTAEAGEFKSMLGEAKMVRKTEAGLISPFLPALASLPNQERERVRNQTAKFRELVAFGVTPDRWRTGIEYLRDDGHLLDPDADTERLMGMYETRQDMLPHLDATDHALDLLGELEKEGAPMVADALKTAAGLAHAADAASRYWVNPDPLGLSPTPGRNAVSPRPAPPLGEPVAGNPAGQYGQGAAVSIRAGLDNPPLTFGGPSAGVGGPSAATYMQANMTTQPPIHQATPATTPPAIVSGARSVIPPVDSAGALDDSRFEVGKDYRMPDGSIWRWNGRELTPANPRAAAQADATGAGGFGSGFTNPPTGLDNDAEYTGLQTQIGEAESKLAAKESLADAQEHALRREGVTPYESARVTGALREEAKTEAGNLAAMRARQAKLTKSAPTTAAPYAPAMTDMDDAGLTSLVDTRIDIDEIAALEPRTYDEYMRYARAIAEAAGMKEDELTGLESLLTSDENGMPRDLSGSDIVPAEARQNYDRFVDAALARRGTPLDFPRAAGGAIDMTLVQPGFVYKAGDSTLFTVDPDRQSFVEVRKRREPNAAGGLYDTVAGGESVGARDMRYRAKGRGQEVTHDIPMTADGRVNVWDLDKRVIYETGDGTTFQLDETGENFREVYRDRRAGAWLARSDPGYGNPGVSNLSEEMEYDRDALAVDRETGFRFTMEAAKIHTLAVEMTGVRQRLATLRRADPPYEDWRIDTLKDRLAEGMPRLRQMHAGLVWKAKPEALGVGGMAGRMDDPARLENAANSAIQSGGKVFASIPMFMAVSESMFFRDVYADWDEIDKNRDYLEFGLSPNSQRESLAYHYSLADDETRKWLRQRYRKYLDPRGTGLYKAGQNLKSALEEEFETNPKYADEFFASTLPTVIGEMLAKGATVATLHAIGIPVPVSEALLGSMTESTSLFQKALADNMPIDEAYRQFGFGALMGMTDGLPLAELLQRADKASGGAVGGLLKDAMAEGTEGALIEAIQQAGEIARFSKTAEPDEVAAVFTSEAMAEVAFSLLGAKQ